MRPTTLKVLLLTALLGTTGLVRAQDQDTDGPGRGVARISLINGDVSVRRGDSGEWVAGAVNAPLVVEDSVNTGPASRAEVQFDAANVIRLAGESEIRLAQLDNQHYIVQVARGTVIFRVLRDSDASFELSTPSVSVRPLKQGIYRITVRETGESEITIRAGEAEIFTPKGAERLSSGRTMVARGSASDPEFQVIQAVPQDDWDRWNDERDRYFERSTSYRNAGPGSGIYGTEDLDAYGSWVNVPPYGWCWYPRGMAAGWAPYSYGHWVWIDWYGWTWVDYSPWGWAPYHYGRWFNQAPYGWCWFPGPIGPRHYWRPGLVAFFGFGGVRAGVGFGFGNVGWVPLAPYEPFYPWYGSRYYHGFRNTTIGNRIAVVNNYNVINGYRNARIANGVTAMNAGQFGRGGSMMRVSGDQLSNAGLVRGQLPLAPGRESLRLTNREVNPAALPRSAIQGRFFSHAQPAQVDRVPFATQQRSMQQMTMRTGGGALAGTGQAGRPAMTTAPAMRSQTPSSLAPSVGRSRPEAVQTPRATQQDSGGWRRFGEPNRSVEPQGRSSTGRDGVSSPQRYQGNVAPGASAAGRFQRSDTPQPRYEPRGGGQTLRINPPIVQQRAAPQAQPRVARPSGGGGGSHTTSSPSHGGGGGHGGRNR